MSADSVLDQAFTTLLAKAQRPLLDATATAPPIRPATINFEWTGAGSPIAVAVDPISFASSPAAVDPILVEVPFACTIGWAHMFAGDAAGNFQTADARVDVRLTQLGLGSSVSLSGTGAGPALSGVGAAILDLEGWQSNLVVGDILIARLTSFSGSATWVALTLQLLPTHVGLGVAGIVDNNGDQIVDNDGNPIVMRN